MKPECSASKENYFLKSVISLFTAKYKTQEKFLYVC